MTDQSLSTSPNDFYTSSPHPSPQDKKQRKLEAIENCGKFRVAAGVYSCKAWRNKECPRCFQHRVTELQNRIARALSMCEITFGLVNKRQASKLTRLIPVNRYMRLPGKEKDLFLADSIFYESSSILHGIDLLDLELWADTPGRRNISGLLGAETVISTVKPHAIIRKVRTPRPGFVYLIKADNGVYKIGVATNVKNRLDRLDIVLPYALETIHTIQTDDMYSLELKLHRKFKSKRIKGEWFNLQLRDVEYIKGL